MNLERTRLSASCSNQDKVDKAMAKKIVIKIMILRFEKIQMNLDTSLTHFTRINSRSIIELNVTCETIELLEDNIRENLSDLGYGNDFLDYSTNSWKK